MPSQYKHRACYSRSHSKSEIEACKYDRENKRHEKRIDPNLLSLELWQDIRGMEECEVVKDTVVLIQKIASDSSCDNSSEENGSDEVTRIPPLEFLIYNKVKALMMKGASRRSIV